MDIPVSLVSQSINSGDVLLSAFEWIDHKKYFVIVGVSNDDTCGFCFINTDINSRIAGKDELLALQYHIRHQDYDFLHHDSFLDTSHVYEKALDDIAEGLVSGTIKRLGGLKVEHIGDIKDMMLNSKAISNKIKKKYITG